MRNLRIQISQSEFVLCSLLELYAIHHLNMISNTLLHLAMNDLLDEIVGEIAKIERIIEIPKVENILVETYSHLF